jgi:hypothetical protein
MITFYAENKVSLHIMFEGKVTSLTLYLAVHHKELYAMPWKMFQKKFVQISGINITYKIIIMLVFLALPIHCLICL